MQPPEAKEKIAELSNFEVHDISLLGSGTDSTAFLVNDEWVFRFPLVNQAKKTVQKETALLPQLN